MFQRKITEDNELPYDKSVKLPHQADLIIDAFEAIKKDIRNVNSNLSGHESVDNLVIDLNNFISHLRNSNLKSVKLSLLRDYFTPIPGAVNPSEPDFLNIIKRSITKNSKLDLVLLQKLLTQWTSDISKGLKILIPQTPSKAGNYLRPSSPIKIYTASSRIKQNVEEGKSILRRPTFSLDASSLMPIAISPFREIVHSIDEVLAALVLENKNSKALNFFQVRINKKHFTDDALGAKKKLEYYIKKAQKDFPKKASCLNCSNFFPKNLTQDLQVIKLISEIDIDNFIVSSDKEKQAYVKSVQDDLYKIKPLDINKKESKIPHSYAHPTPSNPKK